MQDPKLEGKVIDALRELAGAVGETTEKLWPMAVKATWAEGVAGLIVGLSIAAFSVVFAVYSFRTIPIWLGPSEDFPARGIALVFCLAAFLLSFSISVSMCLPAILAPEGETLFRILGQ